MVQRQVIRVYIAGADGLADVNIFCGLLPHGLAQLHSATGINGADVFAKICGFPFYVHVYQKGATGFHAVQRGQGGQV